MSLDASESSDPDGDVVSWAWDFGDGKKASGERVSHRFEESGSYTVKLTVVDDEGLTDSTSQIVIVTVLRPSAAFTWQPLTPEGSKLVVEPRTGDRIHFDASASSDLDGEIVEYAWDWTSDGTFDETTADPVVDYQFIAPGSHRVTLRVTDDDGAIDEVTKTVAIADQQPPQAVFSFAPLEPITGQAVSFDASASSDPGGEIVTYAWDFDADGAVDTEGVTAEWTFAQEGEYTVALTVTDSNEATDHVEQSLTVLCPSEPLELGDVWALVVGIGDYQHELIDDLLYTEPDAIAFHDFLVRPEHGGFPADHVRLLLGQQATANEMRDAFTWLADRALADDLVVVYYSGHGAFALDRNNDEGDGLDEYLAPWDTDWERIEATAICDDEIGYWLSNLRSRNVLLVLDSCFSGGAMRGARSFSQQGTKAGPGNRVFTDLIGEGRLFLAASQEAEAALEDAQLGHGVFTYFLLKGLGGLEEEPSEPEADSNNDGRVTVRELKTYLVREVARYSRQTPQIIGDEKLLDAPITGYQQSPMALFSWMPERLAAGLPLQFHDESTDDGGIVAYAWDFGDGASSDEQAPMHTYTDEGVYTVTLTVTDDVGLQTMTSIELIIGPQGEVTAIAGDRIIISLGSAHGVQVGDRFEVVRVYQLADGTVVQEMQAEIEIIEVIAEDRSACIVLELLHSVEMGYKVRFVGQ